MVVTAADLDEGLALIRQSPADDGRLDLIVRRPAMEQREVVASAELDPAVGLVGDMWSARPSTSSPDGGPHPDRQLTLMNFRGPAGLVAVDPDRIPLAGDQLYLGLDLSVANLPAGSRLAIGDAVVEITEAPHLGCRKFAARFGREALAFVNGSPGRELRLRGANARVVSAGKVATGDPVRKLSGGVDASGFMSL